MAERPIVAPADRIPAPAGGAARVLRAAAVLQVLVAAGTLADWMYGDFHDATQLASGIGFALMAPASAFAWRPAMPHARLLRSACAIGVVLVIGAMLARWAVLSQT